MMRRYSQNKFLAIAVSVSLIGLFYDDVKKKFQFSNRFINNSKLYSLFDNYLSVYCDSSNIPLSLDKKVNHTNVDSSTETLTLVGEGKRRKNLYIVEVDVYLIGISFSNDTLKLAKEWNNIFKNIKSLPEYIYENMNSNPQSNKTVLTATLQFYRNVTKVQFLNAFEEAFKGCDIVAINDFKNAFSELIQDDVKTKDEFIIYWLNNGNVTISRNGIIGKTLSNKELNKRFLEVYIDSKKTVSMELYTSLENNIKNL